MIAQIVALFALVFLVCVMVAPFVLIYAIAFDKKWKWLDIMGATTFNDFKRIAEKEAENGERLPQ